MSSYHVAQVNIGRIRAGLDDPIMAGFVQRLDEINALADASPGFVWRLQTNEGNATYLRPYEDERVILNMSVWESVDALRQFVFHTSHRELLRQRQAWFQKFEGAYAALWWVPAGHIPGIDEARRRIAHLDAHGPTQFAFTFQTVPPVDEQFQHRIDWSSFLPCPAG
jgi:heme-degrading monooxygenase HmoA